MDTKEGWESYNSSGCIPDDGMLLAMMDDVVNTIRSLERMYGTSRASIVVRGILNDWHALSGMAHARGLPSHKIPRL
jgi:hypothetical protein